jgi:hypothetical protein
MRWLKWIFAYFFDCIHRRITWPHREPAGQVYVACLDCGREVPYSVKQMRIITADEQLRKPWRTRSAATASLALVSAFLLINLTNAARGASCVPAEQAPIDASQLHDAIPTLVVGFVGGFVHADDVRHSEVQLARTLQEKYGDQVKVEIFKNRDAVQAHEAIVEWWNSLGGNMLPQSSTPAAGIILFGHSWGASTVVYVARELEREGIPVVLTIQVDSVRKNGEDDSVIPANVVEGVNFYQTKGLIHGRTAIAAADPSRTTILGNFEFKYEKEPAACRAYPWYDRVFFKSHTAIECDPLVWSQVQSLIETRLRRSAKRAQEEAAAAAY